MASSNSRVLNAVSAEELQRRWTAVRARMAELRIDALVVQNSSDWVGGYIRWFSNQPATNGYTSCLVFPLDGSMTFIDQGPFGGERLASEAEARSTGIARHLTTPSYPSVGYTGHYDADLAVGELRRLGARRVGLVGPAAMYYSFAQHLVTTLSGVDIVDATDCVDRIKAIKSAEERALMRRVAAMQDEVMARVEALTLDDVAAVAAEVPAAAAATPEGAAAPAGRGGVVRRRPQAAEAVTPAAGEADAGAAT